MLFVVFIVGLLCLDLLELFGTIVASLMALDAGYGNRAFRKFSFNRCEWKLPAAALANYCEIPFASYPLNLWQHP